jgi:hypothetical protein
LNISWDFDVLGEVVRKRGIFLPPAGDRRAIDIYLMLITSKAKFINHLRCTLQELILEDAV